MPRHLKGLVKAVAYFKFYKRIAVNSYDLLAHFSNDWRGAILQRLFPAKLSIARKTHRRGLFWHRSFDLLTESLDDVRAIVEQDVDLIRAADLFKSKKAPPYLVRPSLKNRTKIKSWLSQKSI
jgi:ADP-heptose:LPS heptosyltransferase